MAKIKITPEKFDEVKKYLSFSSRKDTALVSNVSLATVAKISKCEDYDDFLALRVSERIVDEEGLKRLKSLEGEPLFWEVHSRLRRVALRTLKAYTNCSIRELYWMRKAEDYEAYLSCKDKPMPTKFRDRARANASLRDEIRKRYQDGEQSSALANIYGLPYADIQGILSDRIEKPSKEGKRFRRHINSAVAEIIRYGIARGVAQLKIALDLNISYHSVWRVARNKYEYERNEITWERYKEERLLKRDRQFVFPGENFYMFSLRKYCGLSECPEWCKTFVKGNEETQPQLAKVKAEESQQDEPTEECKQEGSTRELPHTEKPIQNEKEISIPVKIEKDGHNLTLTININLSL